MAAVRVFDLEVRASDPHVRVLYLCIRKQLFEIKNGIEFNFYQIINTYNTITQIFTEIVVTVRKQEAVYPRASLANLSAGGSFQPINAKYN